MRVLVADDDSTISHLLEMMLHSLGHTSSVAVNGVQAVKAVREESFDLVIMDIGMPDLDGIGATRIIVRERNVPLIFCSGTCNVATMESARKLGVLGYLVKPFTRDQLYTTINLAITQHQRLKVAEEKIASMSQVIDDMRVLTNAVDVMVDRYKVTRREAEARIQDISGRKGCTPVEAARSILVALQIVRENPPETFSGAV